MYLLHGFLKTTRKAPPRDLRLAEKRWKMIKPPEVKMHSLLERKSKSRSS